MTHRNWPAICEMGTQSKLLMTLLATVDLTSKVGQRLVAAFPECFSATPIGGPIPLTVLKEEARQAAIAQGCGEIAGKHLLQSFDALDFFRIPYIEFGKTPESEKEHNIPPLPPHISKNSKFGDLVMHEGIRWIVVEDNDNPGVDVLVISPAECIAVDL
jgi:hypothetical protein